MIPIKTERQIVQIREACAVAAAVLQELKGLVRPGISTQDIEEAAHVTMERLGARSACFGYRMGSRRYPAHSCISVNEEVVHGIPSFRRILRDGDIVSIDIVVNYNGFIGDNAVTVPVGLLKPQWEKLLQVTEESLRLGIAQARVGNRIGDISNAVQTYVEANG
ncbi:MAG: type I methionyl aminopeptidase, partial [Verrucomicrobiales bacterium]|nr:type I methionyl aminopeptidase [Verrucomicrobiales bacterium]